MLRVMMQRTAIHRFLVSYSHHPPSLSTFLPPSALAISPLFHVDNTQSLSSLSSMAPGENWMTMQRKSPSLPQPSAQLPAKQLTSPLHPLFPPSSAPRPASTSSSAERAADGCPSPISYWDQSGSTGWKFDNTISCDSTGCSYDERKNPRMAKYAITVSEFDDCSYNEYEDTVFLCSQCNMKCLRKVNGSKIKSKMPIEQFLAQREDSEDSFSAATVGLPLPPPSASDFPELPRAAPLPKMTKAEKAMADKISSLLLSSSKDKVHPGPVKALPKPAAELPMPAQTAGSAAKAPMPATKPAALPPLLGIIAIPANIRSELVCSSPQPSGAATPIMAMATFHAEHVVSCPHDTSECGVCRVGITCCKCHLMYTAPAAKRMRCTKCLHWVCNLDQSTGCCECGTPWVPMEVIRSPTTAAENKPATRFRGGVGSDNASESLSTNTAQNDSTVRIQVTAPTQESLDEIDALSHPSTAKPAKEKGKPRTRHQPKSGQSSREPSRPSSVALDRLSVTETVLHKPDYEAGN